MCRDGGPSGEIDLTHLNLGNYDLIVIDESYNFRNKRSPRQRAETCYDRLMRRIARALRSEVAMLDARKYGQPFPP